MKKIVSIMLAAILIVSTMSVIGADIVTFAAKNGECGEKVSWTLNSKGVLTISGKGEMSNFLSESIWKKYTVKSCIINSGVTSVGSSAFQDCKTLKSITIPSSVTRIESYAFYGCSALETINIPKKVASISDFAFGNCVNLKSITFPSCLTFIGWSTFYGCTELTSIKIPSSVTTICDRAFLKCSKLTSITVDKNNSKYDSRNGCNAIIEKSTNKLIQGCNTTVIPKGVKSIEEFAFSDYKGLTSINIPSSVTGIGYGAFSHCIGLTSIKVDKKNKKYDSRNNCNAIIEKSTKTLVQGCKSTVIPNGITKIGDASFFGCTDLETIKIPSSVKSIGVSAFEGCTGLQIIKIPSSVTSIDTNAFFGCTSLNKVYIPKSVTLIGRNAFGVYQKNDSYKLLSDFTIFGVTGSQAENYVKNSEIKFVKHSKHTYKEKITPATTKTDGKIALVCVCGIEKSSTKINKVSRVKLSATSYIYTGKAIKPNVTVKDSKGKTVSSKYYTLTYKNNTNTGKATVSVIFNGNYSGKKVCTFKILPKQVTSLKASNTTTSSVKISWLKASGAKYYKIDFSSNGKKWSTVLTTTATSYTVSNLKSGTKYYFRVTALDSTKKIAGKTSETLTAKTYAKS